LGLEKKLTRFPFNACCPVIVLFAYRSFIKITQQQNCAIKASLTIVNLGRNVGTFPIHIPLVKEKNW
jgi:hypothetical protein